MRKIRPPKELVFCVLAVLAFSRCAHSPISRERDPAELLQAACSPGAGVREVKGSVWMKAVSREASGQFPATVLATAPDRLQMEVTNLLGGTEALISVQGKDYSVRVPNQKGRDRKGVHSWGGIPLRWATDLFLGRVPCPSGTDSGTRKLVVSESGELSVEVPASLEGDAQFFTYRFRSWAGQPWAEALSWERKGAFPVRVDFKFEDPEDKTGSPKKWEAKSSTGEVKVRWKDREMLR